MLVLSYFSSFLVEVRLCECNELWTGLFMCLSAVHCCPLFFSLFKHLLCCLSLSVCVSLCQSWSFAKVITHYEVNGAVFLPLSFTLSFCPIQTDEAAVCVYVYEYHMCCVL